MLLLFCRKDFREAESGPSSNPLPAMPAQGHISAYSGPAREQNARFDEGVFRFQTPPVKPLWHSRWSNAGEWNRSAIIKLHQTAFCKTGNGAGLVARAEHRDRRHDLVQTGLHQALGHLDDAGVRPRLGSKFFRKRAIPLRQIRICTRAHALQIEFEKPNSAH